jgi:DNA-binding NarL/FixJ family response regulator
MVGGRRLNVVTRLLLADDNRDLLEMLVEILRREFTIVGALSSGASVLEQAAALKPDIILLDVSLGDTTGFCVARSLMNSGCQAKIVFLSVHEGFDFVRAALDIGALGYVFKSRINWDLVNALQAASRGDRFVPGGPG